jgi:hypothetical protein
MPGPRGEHPAAMPVAVHRDSSALPSPLPSPHRRNVRKATADRAK